MDFSDFIVDLSLRGFSPETIKAYKSDLEFFGSYLEDRGLKLRQVTHTIVGEFRMYMTTLKGRSESLGLAPATIDRRMAVLASFFEHLCRLNPRRKNPIQAFKERTPRRYRSRDYRGKAVDDPSMQALLDGIDSLRDRAMFSLFVASGLRLSELAQLDIDSLSEERETGSDDIERVLGTGTVIGKGNKQRRFYFDQDAIAAIAAYLETRTDNCPALFISQSDTRLSGRAIQYTLSTWCSRLGLKHIHPHSLRHTFATNLANANMDALVLQSLMGHANFETTTRYFRLAEDMKARQYYGAMEFVRGPEA
jgi:site-specific recombinase XerD